MHELHLEPCFVDTVPQCLLFQPAVVVMCRPCLLGICHLPACLQGPDVGDQVEVLMTEAGEVAQGAEYTPVAQRLEQLKAWAASNSS